MTLIKSVSGIRGTIGGKTGNNLTPIDLVKFTTAFVQIIKNQQQKNKIHIVLGRDSRISGEMVAGIVKNTLVACGVDVTDLGQATTPTTEVAVCQLNADGGIILTASHNPQNWNALKLLNHKGEFISAETGRQLLEISENTQELNQYVAVEELGTITENKQMLDKHIDIILNDRLVDKQSIQEQKYKIVVDGINSVGGFAIPELLKKLGVDDVIVINGTPNGNFAHNPEPLSQNLTQLKETVKNENAHLGIAVDPDADRLAFISENGEMFGEEYTLVAVADYVLQHVKSPTVSNLSSSRALRDIAEKHGVEYHSSAVGELNVTTKMKQVNAKIGGEGNGGVIYPDIRFGRDALTGTALFLTLLSKSGKKMSELRATYPNYVMVKSKINLSPEINTKAILNKIEEHFANQNDVEINTIDGVKIDFPKSWVHLRPSNTEPIIRIYTEANTKNEAEDLLSKIKSVIQDLI